jgi:hypothetical protein
VRVRKLGYFLVSGLSCIDVRAWVEEISEYRVVTDGQLKGDSLDG